MTPTTVTKKLVAMRFARSTDTYDGAAVVQRDMACGLVGGIERALENRACGRALELGCGTGLFTELLVRRIQLQHLTLNDLATDLSRVVERCLSCVPRLMLDLLPGDMERIHLPDQQDLVMANAALQWAEDPAALLRKMVECLRPGGILAIATFGPLNLQETASLTGLSLRYLSIHALRAHLDGRAEILQCEEDLRRLSFTSALDVLRHLKHTGANGLGTSTWSRRDIARFCARYQAKYGRGGSVTLTYHPILLVARRNETSSKIETT